MEAKGKSTLKVGFDPGCWWFENDGAWIYLRFGGADRRDLAKEVRYRFRPRNGEEGFSSVVPEGLAVVRR